MHEFLITIIYFLRKKLWGNFCIFKSLSSPTYLQESPTGITGSALYLQGAWLTTIISKRGDDE
jgi:hypothetical protein